MTLDTAELRSAADAAHRHADALAAEIETAYPGVWQHLDQMRRGRPVLWPDWCLLPMAAPATLVAETGRAPGGATIAAMSAVYAWRYTRSVWLAEPDLMDRLLSAVPDPLDGVQDLAGLPQWCVYLLDPGSETPGTGLWMHLEHDANTGRPELRLLLDVDPAAGVGGLLPVPVYLDRPTVTEALADWRATAWASLTRRGADMRGGDLDAQVAQFADRVEVYVAVARYLCRPEADIVALPPAVGRPLRYRSPVRDRATWLVGYADLLT